MAAEQEHQDDNFVMSHETPPQEEDKREEYLEAAATGSDVKSRLPIVIGAAGLVLVVAILWGMLSGGGRQAGDETLQKLDSRLTQLEEKLAKIEWLDQGLARLDKQEKAADELVRRIDDIDAALKSELSRLGQKIKTLEKNPGATAGGRAAPVAAAAEKNDSKPKLHQVSAGENLYRIGQKYGLSVEQLREFNNLSASSTIYPGQKLKLSP